MGLLGDIYSASDRVKRNLAGLLNDPSGTLEQWGDQIKNGLLDYGAANKAALDNPSDTQKLAAALRANMDAVGVAPLGIVSPSKAATLNIRKALPSDPLFAEAVANTKGASISDDGLRMALSRNQNPNQSMQPSVRGGVFYLPEGAAQSKYYSTGKNGYGGTEKVSGETLIANPLFAKGGTGGKAPQSAYDSLNGKGAYEAMRTDALSAYGRYGATASEREEGVRKFLDKYAPELSDMAGYISKNSTQGNQLAYALQEAAVGSAVRNAGHDAVVGYSKGKSGPFLSEIFDVRESHYPDKFGGNKIWPSLLSE